MWETDEPSAEAGASACPPCWTELYLLKHANYPQHSPFITETPSQCYNQIIMNNNVRRRNKYWFFTASNLFSEGCMMTSKQISTRSMTRARSLMPPFALLNYPHPHSKCKHCLKSDLPSWTWHGVYRLASNQTGANKSAGSPNKSLNKANS